MSVLKRVSPVFVFLKQLTAYEIVGLIVGMFCSLIAVTGARFAAHAHMPIVSRVGVFAVILCPIFYGIIGGIGAVIAAGIYNLTADWVGGLEVDIG